MSQRRPDTIFAFADQKRDYYESHHGRTLHDMPRTLRNQLSMCYRPRERFARPLEFTPEETLNPQDENFLDGGQALIGDLRQFRVVMRLGPAAAQQPIAHPQVDQDIASRKYDDHRGSHGGIERHDR